ncbi:helix-turn-helix domain-containing protein [Candidatus Micrarchaeota archaeon]|nr:helix-turn-helix domain-containing protein [Candidatus Micrarchaeota archaeon]
MKVYELGVFHHDCWNSNAITKFPEAESIELGARQLTRANNTTVNASIWRINCEKKEETSDYVKFVKKQDGIIDVAVLAEDGASALVGITWKARETSYEAVVKSGCAYHSNTYSKNGYEAYTVYAEDAREITKLLDEFEEIGETKIFKIKNEEKMKKENKFNLTDKQKQAVTQAVANGYYEWPKKNNLEELARKLGRKRRTLQEHLRKAEGKIITETASEFYGQQ